MPCFQTGQSPEHHSGAQEGPKVLVNEDPEEARWKDAVGLILQILVDVGADLSARFSIGFS